GAAISIATGEITRAEWKKYDVLIHPDTNNAIVGYRFDNWQELLSIACLAQKASGLGYAGVDLILDINGRALVLEVNKRPGLEIQNINQHSLLTRLKYLEEQSIDLTEQSPIRAARTGIELTKAIWEVKSK
ncbi:MAG: sugar-transfer associated ATP-grasp domain-containing protein, partial [Candidatus Heimdallarchaeota archaeon]